MIALLIFFMPILLILGGGVMVYIEMARDIEHGGDTWAFPNCVWAPTKKRDDNSWIFWKKILQIKKGDIILHLRGKSPKACFVGYSVAAGDGFETTRRPPEPKQWKFAESFYRADLSEYIEFHNPINLLDLFEVRKIELDTYFDMNKTLNSNKSNIFFVRQSGKLRCLNGAYLSDVDENLLLALFGGDGPINSSLNDSTVISVQTGSQISTVRSRLGQAKFSSEIKRLYGNRCCFPRCQVSDSRFLIGSHIARWSDNKDLRGHMGNGLCFCLVHDKAFEIGLFTLDEQFRVFFNPREKTSDSAIIHDLLKQHGKQITMAEVQPLDDALLEHWMRVDIEP
jgi:putative restriction endonuclease